jgi:hypothetical protein
MRRKDVVASVLVALVVILITAGPALAQTNLVPNEQKDNDHMWGGDSISYMATLEIGHWTVTVETSFSLEVKITVALDNTYTDVIAVSGEGSGNFPTVDFTLNESATVYIRVAENSVYGDTSGFYDIGVYDDSNVPILPLLGLDFFTFMIILSFGIPLVICIVCALFARRNAKVLGTISTDSAYDITALPRKTRKLLREQLPTNCPNCDGGLTYGTVRWVGPRTAECPYCGSPVLLETVEIDID